MKQLRYLFVLPICAFLFGSCVDEYERIDANGYPGNLDELKTAIQNVWNYPTSDATYSSIEFEKDMSYTIIYKNATSMPRVYAPPVQYGKYVINNDLHTIKLHASGGTETATVYVNSVGNNGMNFDLTPTSGTKKTIETTKQVLPAIVGYKGGAIAQFATTPDGAANVISFTSDNAGLMTAYKVANGEAVAITRSPGQLKFGNSMVVTLDGKGYATSIAQSIQTSPTKAYKIKYNDAGQLRAIVDVNSLYIVNQTYYYGYTAGRLSDNSAYSSTNVVKSYKYTYDRLMNDHNILVPGITKQLSLVDGDQLLAVCYYLKALGNSPSSMLVTKIEDVVNTTTSDVTNIFGGTPSTELTSASDGTTTIHVKYVGATPL